MKRVITLLLALIMTLSITGCSMRNVEETPEVSQTPEAAETPEPTPEVTPEPTPEATPEPTPEPTPEVTPEPAYRNPLTGEGLDEAHTTRVTAVMLNNHPQAQPQCGMGDADIVYEILAEGGVTRMVALYSDIREIGAIGSIRSSRTYYVDIALAFDAIYVHSGGSDSAYSRLKYFDVDRIDGTRGPTGADTFYRDSARRAAGYAIEHTQFTTGEKIYAFAGEQDYRLTIDETYDSGLRFTDNAVPGEGESADKIEVVFIKDSKYTNFTYDSDKSAYTAYQLGKDYIDGNNEEKVEFNNVIILKVETRVVDGEGRRDMTLVGEGEGYFACGGKYVPIKWSRESDNAPFRYYNIDGSELLINVGTTYIGFVPTTKSDVIFE